MSGITLRYKCVSLRVEDYRGERKWLAEFEQDFDEERPGCRPRLTMEHKEPLLFDLGEVYEMKLCEWGP